MRINYVSARASSSAKDKSDLDNIYLHHSLNNTSKASSFARTSYPTSYNVSPSGKKETIRGISWRGCGSEAEFLSLSLSPFNFTLFRIFASLRRAEETGNSATGRNIAAAFKDNERFFPLRLLERTFKFAVNNRPKVEKQRIVVISVCTRVLRTLPATSKPSSKFFRHEYTLYVLLILRKK